MTKKNIWVVALMLALTFVFFSCGDEFDYNYGETFYEGPPFDWGDVLAEGLAPTGIFGSSATASWDDDDEIIVVDRTAGGAAGMFFWLPDFDIPSFDPTSQTVTFDVLVIVEGGRAALTLKVPLEDTKQDLLEADFPAGTDVFYTSDFATSASPTDIQTLELTRADFQGPSQGALDGGTQALVFQFNDWQNAGMKFQMKILDIRISNN